MISKVTMPKSLLKITGKASDKDWHNAFPGWAKH
jgi:hypothetical protein